MERSNTYTFFVIAVADPSRTESQEEVKKREVQQKLLNSIPLARFGLPQELQGAVLMLCGAASGENLLDNLNVFAAC